MGPAVTTPRGVCSRRCARSRILFELSVSPCRGEWDPKVDLEQHLEWLKRFSEWPVEVNRPRPGPIEDWKLDGSELEPMVSVR